MQFDWKNPYPDDPQPPDGAQRRVDLASAGLAGRPAHAAQGRQCDRRGDRRGGGADHRRADLQRPGQRQLRDPVGRQGPARPQFVGCCAGGLEPGLLPQSRHGGEMPERGWDSVTTPGAVAGWVALSTRFGKLPFADLMEPAIELAERGHGVACIVADKWARQMPVLQGPSPVLPRPSCRAAVRRCRASVSCSATPAQTLRKIAETEGETFYRGEVAEALVAQRRPTAAA